jgi:acetate---CoA ligase (ADP-forming)
MDFFFNPRGIALIGATPNPQKGGHAILRNLRIGFKGGIYPVNPSYAEIEGMSCYPSILEVPDPVDLGIIFVPAPMVPQVVQECARRQIPGVMIESGGFAETGKSGAIFQDAIKSITQESGIRVWGPNCMGLVDIVKGYIFSFATPYDLGLWAETRESLHDRSKRHAFRGLSNRHYDPRHYRREQGLFHWKQNRY